MKATKFLTFALAANLGAAVASGWAPANKILVVINALAVLLLIAVQIFSRKD
jgi:hypothetical protein